MFSSAWVSNNVEGSYKRSVSLAMTIGLCVSFLWPTTPKLTISESGNLNGAVSSNVVRQIHSTDIIPLTILFFSTVLEIHRGTRWVTVSFSYISG